VNEEELEAGGRLRGWSRSMRIFRYTLLANLPNGDWVGKGNAQKVPLGNCPPPAMWALSRPASDLVCTSVQGPSDLVYIFRGEGACGALVGHHENICITYYLTLEKSIFRKKSIFRCAEPTQSPTTDIFPGEKWLPL
jgi:hypothetical protein